MTKDDFEQLGIKLADMRMLIEKFCDVHKEKKKKIDLRELVSNVRSGHGEKISSKRKKPDNINVHFNWFNEQHGKLTQVLATGGGGVRQKRLNRSSSFIDCFNEAKNLFFPSGRNKKGNIKDFSCKLMSFDLREQLAPDIESSIVQNIAEYVLVNGLKIAKFAFTTKEKTFLEKMSFNESSSDNDDDKVPIKKSNAIVSLILKLFKTYYLLMLTEPARDLFVCALFKSNSSLKKNCSN